MTLAKSSKALVIDAINEQSGSKFKVTDLTFEVPQVVSEKDRNTKVRVTATESSKAFGSMNIWYDRLDIARLFEISSIEVELHTAQVNSTKDLLPELNLLYGLGLEAEDIVDEQLVTDDRPINAEIKMQPTCLAFTGTLLVTLVDGLVSLESIITQPVLDGLKYPDPAPDYITKPVIMEGDLTGEAVKEDGTLVVGTGNPAGEMVIAENGELQLALGARRYRDLALIEPVGYDYDIQLDAGGDWNFPFSALLINDEEAEYITDLYDVKLTIKAVETGGELVFALERGEGQYHWVNKELNLDINDSASNDTGTLVQNIQRVKFYVDHLPGVTVNEDGTPVGEFKLELSARRINTIMTRLAVSINVKVTEALVPN